MISVENRSLSAWSCPLPSGMRGVSGSTGEEFLLHGARSMESDEFAATTSGLLKTASEDTTTLARVDLISKPMSSAVSALEFCVNSFGSDRYRS